MQSGSRIPGIGSILPRSQREDPDRPPRSGQAGGQQLFTPHRLSAVRADGVQAYGIMGFLRSQSGCGEL